MKKTWKVMAIAIMLVFSIVSVFAAGRTENATRDPAKNSAQTGAATQANQAAQTGVATQANQAAQSAPTTTVSNNNDGKLYKELPAGTD